MSEKRFNKLVEIDFPFTIDRSRHPIPGMVSYNWNKRRLKPPPSALSRSGSHEGDDELDAVGGDSEVASSNSNGRSLRSSRGSVLSSTPTRDDEEDEDAVSQEEEGTDETNGERKPAARKMPPRSSQSNQEGLPSDQHVSQTDSSAPQRGDINPFPLTRTARRGKRQGDQEGVDKPSEVEQKQCDAAGNSDQKPAAVDPSPFTLKRTTRLRKKQRDLNGVDESSEDGKNQADTMVADKMLDGTFSRARDVSRLNTAVQAKRDEPLKPVSTRRKTRGDTSAVNEVAVEQNSQKSASSQADMSRQTRKRKLEVDEDSDDPLEKEASRTTTSVLRRILRKNPGNEEDAPPNNITAQDHNGNKSEDAAGTNASDVRAQGEKQTAVEVPPNAFGPKRGRPRRTLKTNEDSTADSAVDEGQSKQQGSDVLEKNSCRGKAATEESKPQRGRPRKGSKKDDDVTARSAIAHDQSKHAAADKASTRTAAVTEEDSKPTRGRPRKDFKKDGDIALDSAITHGQSKLAVSEKAFIGTKDATDEDSKPKSGKPRKSLKSDGDIIPAEMAPAAKALTEEDPKSKRGWPRESLKQGEDITPAETAPAIKVLTEEDPKPKRGRPRRSSKQDEETTPAETAPATKVPTEEDSKIKRGRPRKSWKKDEDFSAPEKAPTEKDPKPKRGRARKSLQEDEDLPAGIPTANDQSKQTGSTGPARHGQAKRNEAELPLTTSGRKSGRPRRSAKDKDIPTGDEKQNEVVNNDFMRASMESNGTEAVATTVTRTATRKGTSTARAKKTSVSTTETNSAEADKADNETDTVAEPEAEANEEKDSPPVTGSNGNANWTCVKCGENNFRCFIESKSHEARCLGLQSLAMSPTSTLE